jgi:hypothetical protein
MGNSVTISQKLYYNIIYLFIYLFNIIALLSFSKYLTKLKSIKVFIISLFFNYIIIAFINL